MASYNAGEPIGGGFVTGPFPKDTDVQGRDIRFTDSDQLQFGDADGGDVYMSWDGTNFQVLPATDNTGQIIFGNGTKDIDLKYFLGDTLNYVLFDVSANKIQLVNSIAGGDSAQAFDIDVAPLTGAGGYRQGAVNIQITRASGQVQTWDGNPDCGLKVIARNNAANASAEGAVRGADFQGRNSGTYINWVEGIQINARCDSGKTAVELCGIRLRIESYGTITTAYGIDVNLSVEGAATTKTGILIRNTDQSGMTAVNQVFKVSHTSTNGFTYLFHLNAATGDTFTAGDLLTTAGADVDCDGYLSILVNATPYYIPVFDSVK